MSPEVAKRVVELFRKGCFWPFPSGVATLAVADGQASEQECGGGPGISVQTVGFRLRSIHEKLHVHSRSETFARALFET
jgi:hypothetical protein